MPAKTEVCPCCHVCLAPGLDTDRALVIAFLGGAGAALHRLGPNEALCTRHAALVSEALKFLERAAAAPHAFARVRVPSRKRGGS